MQVQLQLDNIQIENPLYLEKDLITYIGNKRGLLPFIGQGVNIVKSKLNKDKLIFLDLFSGSGVVSRYMKMHAEKIVSNDLEQYAKIINGCYLSNLSSVDFKQLQMVLEELEAKISADWRRGFIAELYAPLDDDCIQQGERAFYTRRNAEYIDTARQHIKDLPIEIQLYFLAPLLVKASIHNNTAGVFKGFYKNRQGIGAFGGEGANALTRILGDIHLQLPLLSRHECEFEVVQNDAVAFSQTSTEQFDLVYLDPPYNQHPYGSNYFMLNLIANYEPPASFSKVSGIPDNWNRSSFNKPYSAKESLFLIVKNVNAKFLLISYNSEGFIQKDEFIAELQSIGKLTILESQYNTYRGSRNLNARNQYVTEYLFLVEKN
jgi:adenine-specific DNA-methyltransferase